MSATLYDMSKSCCYNKYVDCGTTNDKDCKRCGWNPEEYKRRTGHELVRPKRKRWANDTTG